MKKNMKSKSMKKIVVECLKWKEKFDIDSAIFDDVYMEAATRAIEKKIKEGDLKVAVLMYCWENKNEKDVNLHFAYNTYFVLVNAGLHAKAELLRLNFLKLHAVDLQKESLRGESEETEEPKSNNKKEKGKNGDSDGTNSTK